MDDNSLSTSFASSLNLSSLSSSSSRISSSVGRNASFRPSRASSPSFNSPFSLVNNSTLISTTKVTVRRHRSQSRGRSKSRTRGRSVARATAEEAFWASTDPPPDPFTLDLSKTDAELHLPPANRLRLGSTPSAPPSESEEEEEEEGEKGEKGDDDHCGSGDKRIDKLAAKFHADLTAAAAASSDGDDQPKDDPNNNNNNKPITTTTINNTAYSSSELATLSYLVQSYFSSLHSRFLGPTVQWSDLLELGTGFLHLPLYGSRFWRWLTAAHLQADLFSDEQLRSYAVLLFRYRKYQAKAMAKEEVAGGPVSTGTAPVPLYTYTAPVNPFTTLTTAEARRLGYPPLSDLACLDIATSEESADLAPPPSPSEQHQLLKSLRLALFFSRESGPAMATSLTGGEEGVNTTRQSRLLRRSILLYFGMLRERLSRPGVTYLKVYRHHNRLPFWDYASAGHRFWALLEQLFPRAGQLRAFSVLLHHYLALFPPAILRLRNRLMDFEEEELLVGKRQGVSPPRPVPPKAVLYTPIKPWAFYEELRRLPKEEDTLKYFLEATTDPPTAIACLNFLSSSLSTDLARHQLSSNLVRMTALTARHSVDAHGSLTLFLQLDPSTADTYLDDGSSIMAYEAVGGLLSKRHRIKATLLLSHEVTLDLSSCSFEEDEEEDGEDDDYSLTTLLDITLTLKSAFWRHSQLYEWLSSVEPRFAAMTALLKYWAHCSQLIGGGKGGVLKTVHDLVSLVIYALQQTTPPVFESIEKMTTGHAYSHSHSTANRQSTGELLVAFFRLYAAFDFPGQVIRPWTGEACPLAAYPNEATANSMVNIEDWYSLVAYQTVSSSSYARFSGLIRRVEKVIRAENAVLVLANPQLMDPQPVGMLEVPF